MNFQKKALLVLIIAIVLAAVGIVATLEMTPKASRVRFQDILQGEAQFLYASGNGVESMDISDVPALFAPDDPYMKIWDFAIVDLDGDENAEAVLFVYGAAGDAGGYLILHQLDGKFYAYTSDFQSFQELKADGTYSYTIGIGEAGICTISSFTETGFALDKITYGSGPQEGWDTFVVDHQPTTAEIYWEAIDKQNAKPNAIWYEFSSETIETAFGPDM